MDWGALGSRDAVLAICEHFGIDFAQARDHLLARQLQQAVERAAAAAVPRKWRIFGPNDASRGAPNVPATVAHWATLVCGSLKSQPRSSWPTRKMRYLAL
jgi:hypothetical protein